MYNLRYTEANINGIIKSLLCPKRKSISSILVWNFSEDSYIQGSEYTYITNLTYLIF